MFQLIRHAIDREPDTLVLYECRRCGTSLQTASTACPYCGPTDVATFVI